MLDEIMIEMEKLQKSDTSKAIAFLLKAISRTEQQISQDNKTRMKNENGAINDPF